MKCDKCKQSVTVIYDKDFVYKFICGCKQPERLNPEDMNKKGTNPVSADKAHWRFDDTGRPYIHICDSPNSANK